MFRYIMIGAGAVKGCDNTEALQRMEETTEAVEEATGVTADLATTRARGASSRPLHSQTSWARPVAGMSCKSGATKLDMHGLS